MVKEFISSHTAVLPVYSFSSIQFCQVRRLFTFRFAVEVQGETFAKRQLIFKVSLDDSKGKLTLEEVNTCSLV